MAELSEFIEYHQKNQIKEFRKNGQNLIWNNFDRKRINKLNTRVYLPQLLYSFIYLFTRIRYKNIKPPTYNTLRDVLEYFSNTIIKMMPKSERIYLHKKHFEFNIDKYFNQMVNNL